MRGSDTSIRGTKQFKDGWCEGLEEEMEKWKENLTYTLSFTGAGDEAVA